jgi:beta-phosphoglucomutase-like phosphatase (HAD superfamily)
LKAAQKIGIPSDHCILFEDSLTGIEAGRKAGCIVVGVATLHTSKDFSPDLPLVINNFNEIGIGTLISLLGNNNTDKN